MKKAIKQLRNRDLLQYADILYAHTLRQQTHICQIELETVLAQACSSCQGDLSYWANVPRNNKRNHFMIQGAGTSIISWAAKGNLEQTKNAKKSSQNCALLARHCLSC